MPPTANDALTRLLDDGRARATNDPGRAAIWEALAAATEGGKRFRPALVTAAHDALGGTARRAAVEVGAAVELLHTAFVVHDDVIDGDDVRRGRLNVSGTFRAEASSAGASDVEAEAFGRTAGILAGDLALAAAVRAVATCGAPTATTHRLLDLFDAALHTTAAGELADAWWSLDVGTATLDESVTMEEQKTAAYSFALPLQAGAVLAGADEATVARLGEAGRLLGIAYQLVDDLLGVFGDPALTGKSVTCDLRTRKQTPLLAHARTTPEWEQIAPHLGRDLTPEELARTGRLLTSSGSREFVERLAEDHLERARAVLDELGMPDDVLATVSTHPPTLRDAEEVAA